jgi:hypothetical protein
LNCIIGASAAKGDKSAVFTIFYTVVSVTSVYEQRFHNGSQGKTPSQLLHFESQI